RGAFIFWADTDASDWAGTVKLFATGTRDGVTLRHEVRPYTRVWQEGNIGSSRPTRELALAVRESSPFALHPVAERVEVEAGKKAEVKFRLDRQWPDFKDRLTVLPLSIPPNAKMGNAEVPPDKSEVTVNVEIPAGTRPGEYT